MEYRTMGKSGLSLSEISLGTMYYGSYISKEAGIACLNKAIECGINFLDCADRYGIKDNDLPPDQVIPAEKVLGEFLQDHERYDLVLSTKVHHQLRDSPNSGGLTRKHIREQIEMSLDNLGTDYVDLYFCHRPDPNTDIEETIQTMTNLIEDGLINYWGTSWWPPHLIERTIAIARQYGYIPPAAEQPPYHLRARFIENDLFELANYHALGITAFEGLSAGLFTGKYNDGIPEGSRFAELDLVNAEFMENIQPKLRRMQEIADELELEMYQLALAWVLSHDEITSTIMGARLPEQVEMNSKASGISLDKAVIDQLEEIHEDRVPKFDYRYE